MTFIPTMSGCKLLTTAVYFFCLIFHIFIAKNQIIGLHVPKRVRTDLNFLFKKLKIFYFKVTNNVFRGVFKGL